MLAGPLSISVAQLQRDSSSTIPIRIRIELGFKDVLFCTKRITGVPGRRKRLEARARLGD